MQAANLLAQAWKAPPARAATPPRSATPPGTSTPRRIPTPARAARSEALEVPEDNALDDMSDGDLMILFATIAP